MTIIKTVADLDQAIKDVAATFDIPVARVRTTFIGVVTSQMLPNSVELKGGLAIKMRLGELGTRATSDLDAVYTSDYKKTIEEIKYLCKIGWGQVPPSKRQLWANPGAPNRVAFTGAIKEKPQHDPGVDRPEYLMRPLRVSLQFLGKQWGAIDLELAHPEVMANSGTQAPIDTELKMQFESFGFGKITSVRFLSVELQIAQKVHALTHPNSDRAHDLVDLQKLWTAEVDTSILLEACESTFRYRRDHSWPPLPLRPMTADRERYLQAVQEVSTNGQDPDVRPDLDDAREWLENRINTLLNHEEI